MPRIVDGPVYKRVKCNACGSTIEYLPEDIKLEEGHDYTGGSHLAGSIFNAQDPIVRDRGILRYGNAKV